MSTNTETLLSALTYWRRQHDIAKFATTYVIAQPTGIRVLSDNTSAMLSGCCNPFFFNSRSDVDRIAAMMAEFPPDLDGEPPLEAMTYERFCEIQLARFEVALHTVRVADAMAYQHEAA